MKTKSETRLYNVIFPIWLLLFFPQLWIISLPANFLIDLAVFYFTLRCLKISQRKALCKKSILKIWLIGFASDFVGGFFMLFFNLFDVVFDFSAEFMNAICYNPFSRLDAFLWTCLSALVSGMLIYFLNKFITLRKLELTASQKHKLALSLAVLTAPYLFFLPTALFW